MSFSTWTCTSSRVKLAVTETEGKGRLTDCPVEVGWAAAAQTVFAQGLNSAFLNTLITSESAEIVACKVGDRLSVTQKLGLWSNRALNDGNSIKIALFGDV